MPISIDGLVSGLDTETIVEGLLEIQQTQLDRIDLDRTEVLAEQATFASLEAQLLTFRSQVSNLARVQGNPFEQQTVSVSDETILAATASSSAASGIFRLTVNSVARAHQVASGGVADIDSEITTGTLELRVGAGDVTTITVDETNNTLSGLAETINAAETGVTASVIQDASGGDTPFRLLLTSSETGLENEISVTNNLGVTAGDATQPVFDFDNPVQAAANAQITLGSGPGAITVESATNQFNNLIDGVSIDVVNESVGQEVVLTISPDEEAAVTAVEDFVNAFNSVLEFIDSQSQLDPVTEQGGPLLGNRSVIEIEQQLQNAALDVVNGVNREANRLTAIGVSVNDQGRLDFSASEFSNIFNGENPNVGRADLRRLFSLDAASNNSRVDFVLGSTNTQASLNPIQVDLTQAAERASITGTSAAADLTVIDSTNRTVEIDIDGATATLTLSEGTFTQQELADQLEAVINASSDLIGRTAAVAQSGGVLSITSDSFGSSSVVEVTGGTALDALGFTAGTSDTGRDVAGTFIVDGVTESATGRGQLLSGNEDNPTTADLQLRIQLTPSEIVSGPEAEVTVSRGIGATLDSVLDGLLDPVDGSLQTIDEQFDAELESLQESLDRQQELFDIQQQSLIEQFIALESALAELNSTSDFLASQLASLGGSN